MLESFNFTNFESFRRAWLPLKPLTLLIGTNASGKSNAREAIQILSWIATGRRFVDLFRSLPGSNVSLRGRPVDLVYQGPGTQAEKTFTLACRVSDADKYFKLAIELKLERDELRLWHESLIQHVGDKDQRLYDSQSGGVSGHDGQAGFTQLNTPFPSVMGALRTQLTNILFLDPNPSHMRGTSYKGDRVLKEDGATLSSVLYYLCKEQGKKAQVLEFIRCLPEQDIIDVDFLEGPRTTDVLVKLTESFGGIARTWDASMLSDGTLRVLAVAAALLSTPAESLVVIEEIDNGVHPSRARMLLDSIQRVANERSLRVLITTHNPALLDVLPLNASPTCFVAIAIRKKATAA